MRSALEKELEGFRVIEYADLDLEEELAMLIGKERRFGSLVEVQESFGFVVAGCRPSSLLPDASFPVCFPSRMSSPVHI